MNLFQLLYGNLILHQFGSQPNCVQPYVVHSQSSENLFCYIIMQELVFYSGDSAICCSTYPDSNKVKL